MGASGWSYFVPYQTDVSVALQQLRADVFARGDYLYGDGLSKEERDRIIEKTLPKLDPWIQKCKERAATEPEPLRSRLIESAEKLKKNLLKARSESSTQPQPKTIEKLLEVQAATGTHSILDIASVSSKPKFGSISPLDRSKLLELFGSDTPTHAQVEEAYESGCLEELTSRRWQGIYIAVYHDGKPKEIFFAGCSGD